jgi:hypothetical protein
MIMITLKVVEAAVPLEMEEGEVVSEMLMKRNDCVTLPRRPLTTLFDNLSSLLLMVIIAMSELLGVARKESPNEAWGLV